MIEQNRKVLRQERHGVIVSSRPNPYDPEFSHWIFVTGEWGTRKIEISPYEFQTKQLYEDTHISFLEWASILRFLHLLTGPMSIRRVDKV